MDYRYLKAFILTAKFGSFSQAAKELNIAQSAISRQIKLLEESIKEELIIRSSKKMLLTNKGQELFIAASNFDKHADSIFQNEENHVLKIGTLHGLLENWLYPIISEFYTKKNRNMTVSIDTPENLKRDMTKGYYDIIFTNENVQSELISSLKIFNEHLVLISRDEIDPENLQDKRWIIYNDDDNIFKLKSKPSEKIISINSITSIVKLVRSGVGIAVIPDHLLSDRSSLHIYKMKELSHSEIFMTTLNYQVLPSYISELTELIKK